MLWNWLCTFCAYGIHELVGVVITCTRCIQDQASQNTWKRGSVIPTPNWGQWAVDSLWKRDSFFWAHFHWKAYHAPVDGPISILIWVAFSELHGLSEKEDINLGGICWRVLSGIWRGQVGGGYDHISFCTWRKFLRKRWFKKNFIQAAIKVFKISNMRGILWFDYGPNYWIYTCINCHRKKHVKMYTILNIGVKKH